MTKTKDSSSGSEEEIGVSNYSLKTRTSRESLVGKPETGSESLSDLSDASGQIQEKVPRSILNRHLPKNDSFDTKLSTSPASSNRCHGHQKSLHTVLQGSSCGSKKHSSGCFTSSEDYDIEHYKRLLQESEESVSSRDILISMLQEQLKKIEDLYKKHFDESQELRYKYCLATQELSNTKRICEKYKEDVKILTKRKDDIEKAQLDISQKEIGYWKKQYETLLQQTNLVNDKVREVVEKVSKGIQVEMEKHHDLESYIDTLKGHCSNIEDSLSKQNEKLELLMEKLQEGVPQAKELDDVKGKSEKSSRSQLSKHSVVFDDQVANMKNNKTFEDFENELAHARKEIDELNVKNTELQRQINETFVLKGENDSLSSQLLEESKVDRVASAESINAKDSFIQNLRRENSDLREQINTLVDIHRILPDFKECRCEGNKDYYREMIIPENESAIIVKGREGSRVSFVVANDQLQSQLIHLQRKSSGQLINTNSEIQENDNSSEDVETINIEIINLRKQIWYKDNLIKTMQQEAKENAERRNNIVSELSRRYDLLKSDFEEQVDKCSPAIRSLKKEVKERETLIENLQSKIANLQEELRETEIVINKNDKVRNELEEKIQELEKINDDLKNKPILVAENENQIQTLHGKIEELKKELNLTIGDQDLLRNENDRIKEQLEIQIKDAAENVTQVRELQQINVELKTAFDAGNKKYNQELSDYKNQINKLENELSQARLLNERLADDNKNVTSQIEDLTNTLQQHKEIAEFKTLENEKLRQKEDQLQCCLSCFARSNDYVVSEYNRDKEHKDRILLEITEEKEILKTEYETKTSSLYQENVGLLKSVHQREEEIKELKDKLNSLQNELETTKLHHRRDLSSHDRSVIEITNLFKNKEDELFNITKQFENQKEYLEELEEENNSLKSLLSNEKACLLAQEQVLIKMIQQCDSDDNDVNSLWINLSKRIQEFYGYKEDPNHENTKCSKINSSLSKSDNELQNQKMLLKYLIENIKYKIKLLEENTEIDGCLLVPKSSIDKIFNSLEKMNCIISQECSKANTISNNSTESERCLCCQDETQSIDSQIVKDDGITSVFENDNDLSEATAEKLRIKRKYLVAKVKSIGEKLNMLEDGFSMQRSDLPCIRTMFDRTDTEDLLFRCKFYLERIALIDEKLYNTDSISSKTDEKIRESASHNVCLEDWKEYMKIIQQMARDLNDLKTNLRQKEKKLTSALSNKNVHEKDVQTSSTNELQNQIKCIQEQLNDTCAMSRQIKKLEQQLNSQYSKLQELQEKTESTVNVYNSLFEVFPSTKENKLKEDNENIETLKEMSSIGEAASMELSEQYVCKEKLMKDKYSQVKPKDLEERCKNSSDGIKDPSVKHKDVLIVSSTRNTYQPTTSGKCLQNNVSKGTETNDAQNKKKCCEKQGSTQKPTPPNSNSCINRKQTDDNQSSTCFIFNTFLKQKPKCPFKCNKDNLIDKTDKHSN